MNTEKKGLTGREKVLVMLAFCVGLFYFAFQFVIMPFYTDYNGKHDEIDNLTMKKTEMQMKLLNEAVIQERYETIKQLYGELENIFPKVMPNEEIDKILTDLCVRNGLKPASLAMSDPFDVVIAKEGEEKGDYGAVFVQVNANMVLTGSYDSAKRLLDAVVETPHIRISRITYASKEDAEDSVNLMFEVSMLKEIEDITPP